METNNELSVDEIKALANRQNALIGKLQERVGRLTSEVLEKDLVIEQLISEVRRLQEEVKILQSESEDTTDSE